LQLSEFAEPLEIPAYRSAPLRTIYRVLEETQETILRKIHKLKAERRRGFQVLGHMTDGVIAVSPDRRVLLVNRAAWTLLGIKREKAFLGRPCAEVVRVPQILSLVDKVLGGAHAEMVEFDLPGDRELSLRVQAVELPGEGDPGVLVTIRDETQVKQLEKMRREFIANVSHELKTPLAAIRGYAETLQLGAIHDPETCPHFLEQINVQSSRLESLINDMLQLARAQTGNQHLTLGHVTLQPVLRESLSSYAPVAQAREITLQHEPVAATAGVLADREALVTIVNNLLGNAVRYTPEGGHVALEVRDEQDRWAITVRDDGIGIPEEDQRRIFERFYRVEKARDATRGGTGLGLAIVKNLVLALDGEIRLHSRPGEGSTFKVLLPKSVSPSRDSAARQVT
jgi:two-component system phosphate regulon sensor histidine kinase PhoR